VAVAKARELGWSGQKPQATLRWMLFVDGENLTIRAQEFAREHGIELPEDDYFKRDVFIWSHRHALDCVVPEPPNLDGRAVRAHYYTSLQADVNGIEEVRESLRRIGFEPEVFKREKGGRSKGVDIALARDVLAHAFQGHYDAAVLVAGDGDYVPLVEEVKAQGKRVYVAFFSTERWGLSRRLRREADDFFSIDMYFRDSWSCSKRSCHDTNSCGPHDEWGIDVRGLPEEHAASCRWAAQNARRSACENTGERRALLYPIVFVAGEKSGFASVVVGPDAPENRLEVQTTNRERVASIIAERLRALVGS
jgi:uncharacterized LabA/DUF88 family protein